MTKFISNRFIQILSLVIALIGIIQPFMPDNSFKVYVYQFLPAHLSFLDYFTLIRIREANTAINIVETLFNLTLLLGAIIFMCKGEKENRLLRFAYSVILACSTIRLVLGIISTKSLSFSFYTDRAFIPIFLVGCLVSFCYLYLSFNIIHILSQKNELALITSENDDNQEPTLVTASKGQRLIHFIIDTCIAWALVSPLMMYFGDYLRTIAQVLGERFTLTLFFIVGRIFYYFLFEHFFKATPAKFLTQCRLVNDDGENVDFNTLKNRTLYRFIPLEPLSFLSSSGGLHDKWTSTFVVKEKTDKSLSMVYASLLPIMLVLGGGIFIGSNSYNQHLSNLATEEYHKSEQMIKEKQFESLSTDYVLMPEIKYDQVTPSGNLIKSSSTEEVWKIERIEDDTLICLALRPESTYKEGDIVDAYYQQKAHADTVKISKTEMHKTLPEIRNTPKSFIDMKGGQCSYGIQSMHSYFGLEFYLSSSSTGNSSQYEGKLMGQYSFENKGMNGKLLKLETIEGKVDCKSEIPTVILGNHATSADNRFYITIDNITPKETFKILLTAQTYSGDIRKFLLLGKGTSIKIMPH